MRKLGVVLLGVVAVVSVDACGAGKGKAETGPANDAGDVGAGSDASDGGGQAGTVLASGLSYPSAIAVDDANVYWVSNLDPVNSLTGPYTILAMPKGGGTTVTLATIPGGLQPTQLLTDGTAVYFPAIAMDDRGEGSPWAVMSVPVTGGAITTLAGDMSTTDKTFLWDRVAMDGTNVYYVGPPTSAALYRVPKAGGTPVSLATVGDSFYYGLATDGINVYFTSSYGDAYNLAFVPTGGAEAGLDSIQSTNVIGSAQTTGSDYGCALDGELAYWVHTDSTGAEDSILSIPTGGGTIVTLGSTASNRPPKSLPTGVAVDANNVYWTTGAGVVSVPKTGGTVATIATTSTGVSSAFAIDDTNVYWTLQGSTSTAGTGSIMTAPK